MGSICMHTGWSQTNCPQCREAPRCRVFSQLDWLHGVHAMHVCSALCAPVCSTRHTVQVEAALFGTVDVFRRVLHCGFPQELLTKM